MPAAHEIGVDGAVASFPEETAGTDLGDVGEDFGVVRALGKEQAVETAVEPGVGQATTAVLVHGEITAGAGLGGSGRGYAPRIRLRADGTWRRTGRGTATLA